VQLAKSTLKDHSTERGFDEGRGSILTLILRANGPQVKVILLVPHTR
jgi:uncharacterized protein (DUF1697 family)